MIHSLSGKLILKNQSLAVVDASGIGFEIKISGKTYKSLPKIGRKITFFIYPIFSQNGPELYGFLGDQEREIFAMLNSVNGVGPRAALRILSAANIKKLVSAIESGKSDILSKAAGVGVKKAARIVLELKNKISVFKPPKGEAEKTDVDFEIAEALAALGYKKREIENAVAKIPSRAVGFQERLRAALKSIS